MILVKSVIKECDELIICNDEKFLTFLKTFELGSLKIIFIIMIASHA